MALPAMVKSLMYTLPELEDTTPSAKTYTGAKFKTPPGSVKVKVVRDKDTAAAGAMVSAAHVHVGKAPPPRYVATEAAVQLPPTPLSVAPSVHAAAVRLTEKLP